MVKSSVKSLASFTVLALCGCQILDRTPNRYPSSPISFESAIQLDDTAIPLTSHVAQVDTQDDDSEVWSDIGPNEIWVRNVTSPTLLPVLPNQRKATGAAVLVIPGGGFQFVSLANEGYPVAQWLAHNGIAAFVLKYRTMDTPAEEKMFSEYLSEMYERREEGDSIDRSEGLRLATSDATAAIQLIKSRSEEWNIDVERIGVLGFSAGAMTTMNLLTSSNLTSEVKFAGYIYGPMKEIDDPKQATPLFVALARDDELFSGGEFGLIESWIAADYPVEFHLYNSGGHGFGSKDNGLTSDLWIEQFHAWLKSQHIVD